MVSKLIAYNTWANRQVLAQVKTFSTDVFDKKVGGSFGSIKAVMIHLIESDYLWLQRWKGTPLADIPAWTATDVSSLEKVWAPLQDEMSALTHTLKADDNVKFITRKGVPYTLPFIDIVVHMSHHGSYHRGQLTNMIRDLGQAPVSTDYFIFATK